MSVINTNIQAISAARSLNQSQEMLGRSLTRLSSGSKIVNPSDDAAGLAVSEKLDAQNRRVSAAQTNVQNAISYIQTADGFMSGMTKILSRMSELAILGKDVTKNSSDVALYQQEFTALQEQLRQTIGGTTAQIGGTTGVTTPLGQFNGITLFGDDTTSLPDVTAGNFSVGTNPSISPGAIIGEGVIIGNNVTIGPGARIAPGTVIGDGVTIGANAYVAPDQDIGDNVTLQPGAVVSYTTTQDTNAPITDSNGNTIGYHFTPAVPAGTTIGAQTSSSTASGLTVTVGQAVGQTMTIPQINLRTGAMGALIQQDNSGNFTLDLSSDGIIAALTGAIQHVANERSVLGASQSRLELASTTLSVEYENLASAISRIRDVDVASESTAYAKYNILVQSGTAMLAQANQSPNSVLKLLQG